MEHQRLRNQQLNVRAWRKDHVKADQLGSCTKLKEVQQYQPAKYFTPTSVAMPVPVLSSCGRLRVMSSSCGVRGGGREGKWSGCSSRVEHSSAG